MAVNAALYAQKINYKHFNEETEKKNILRIYWMGCLGLWCAEKPVLKIRKIINEIQSLLHMINEPISKMTFERM